MDNSLQILSAKADSLIVGNKILTTAHGWQPGQPIPAPADLILVTLPTGQPLGYVNWSTAKADDTGLWVQRVLARRSRYVDVLQQLIERGLVSTRPMCEAGKSAGPVAICRDMLILPAQAVKSADFQSSIIARAFGLDFNPALEVLRLKIKANEVMLKCY